MPASCSGPLRARRLSIVVLAFASVCALLVQPASAPPALSDRSATHDAQQPKAEPDSADSRGRSAAPKTSPGGRALTPAPQSVSWTGPAVDLSGTVEIIEVGASAGGEQLPGEASQPASTPAVRPMDRPAANAANDQAAGPSPAARASALVAASGGRVVAGGGQARIVIGAVGQTGNNHASEGTTKDVQTDDAPSSSGMGIASTRSASPTSVSPTSALEANGNSRPTETNTSSIQTGPLRQTAKANTSRAQAAATRATRHLPPSLSIPTDPGGYALATTQTDLPTVVALGRDNAGALYAADTLEQITSQARVPGVRIRDWPAMEVRGLVEGFYGPPWPHQGRLDALAHMGRLRMNTYIYTPKDDPYLRAKWREPYPAVELARMRELSGAAHAAGVDFVVALSPGDSVCYSSRADYEATVAVFEQLRSAGITNFYIAFDDLLGDDGLPSDFSCQSDRKRFGGSNPLAGLARAQTHFLNRVQHQYIAPRGLPALWTVPTQYTGTRATTYTEAFGKRLDKRIKVQWTGQDVVTDRITTRQANRAAKNLGTDRLVIWDNFPANDGENQARLFLGPMPPRSADLDAAAVGIVTNPMLQPYASRLAMAEYASFAWNPAGHDAQLARGRALERIAGSSSGPEARALRAFVDVNSQWEFEGWRPTEAWKDIEAFTQALEGDDDAAVAATAETLRARLRLLAGAPSALASIEDAGFYADVGPWLAATSAWADADLAAVDLLLALREGDEAAAQRARARMEAATALASSVKVPGVEDGGRDVMADVGEDGMGELVDEAREAWKDR